MKQIKLNGVTMDAEEAKKIIADLQAQIDAPEEPEFWEGQLVEVRDGDSTRWRQRVFSCLLPGKAPWIYRTKDDRNTEQNIGWKQCRPIRDPNIIQLRELSTNDLVDALVDSIPYIGEETEDIIASIRSSVAKLKAENALQEKFMKTFKYSHGRIAGKTMTVSELKQKLNEYPDDMPVLGTWEGVNGYVTPDRFYVESVHKGCLEDQCDCLMIDVDQY